MFDERVVECFDDMLARSIPGLGALREQTSLLTALYARKYTLCLDLGCSLGAQWQHFIEMFPAPLGFTYYGVEESVPMASEARRRLAKVPGIEKIATHDLRFGLPQEIICDASVIWSLFTLQFLPVEHRRHLIEEAYAALCDGGVLIVAEKMLEHADDPWRHIYHTWKRTQGYSRDLIEQKAASLENILVPLPAASTVELMETAGFYVEPFWQGLSFRAWCGMK